MSSASVTSSKREKQTAELSQELESIKALNSSLQVYLDNLRTFRRNLVAMNNNCQQLCKVNTQWIDTLNSMMK